MVKLRCNCLNICVDTVGGNLREVDGTSFLSEGPTDSFFGEKLYEVQLAVGGIQKEMDLLIRQRQLEDWVVFKCLGCNTEVFALHSVKGEERVLVSQRIQIDPKKIAELIESENRSPAFKMMLPSTEEDLNIIGNGFSNDNITSAGTCVQEHIKRYLKSEEDAMEERIRCYTAEERKQFARVQSRAFNDKKTMLSILRKAAESKVEESLSDAMADVFDEGLESIFEERPLRLPGGFIEEVTNIEILQASSYPRSPNKKENGTELEGDNFDPIFMADEECEPFVESDDEECSDNSFNQRDEDEKARYSSRSKYSSSVPVNVPLFQSTTSRKQERFLDEDFSEAPSPDKMAESIKALARSVHDSRDIFGDLPRPRVNTLTLPIT